MSRETMTAVSPTAALHALAEDTVQHGAALVAEGRAGVRVHSELVRALGSLGCRVNRENTAAIKRESYIRILDVLGTGAGEVDELVALLVDGELAGWNGREQGVAKRRQNQHSQRDPAKWGPIHNINNHTTRAIICCNAY